MLSKPANCQSQKKTGSNQLGGSVLHSGRRFPVYIVGVYKNSGQGKGYPNSDQTFHADFNELLFILIAL